MDLTKTLWNKDIYIFVTVAVEWRTKSLRIL